MGNPLAGWRIMPTHELRETNRELMRSGRELEEQLKKAKYEYYKFYQSCTSELRKYRELERISREYNINKEVILEYVDRMNMYNK